MTLFSDSRFARVKKLEAAEPVEKSDHVAELARILTGETGIVVGANDDHATHVKAHLNQKAGLIQKVLRGVADGKTLTELENHIAAHRAAL